MASNARDAEREHLEEIAYEDGTEVVVNLREPLDSEKKYDGKLATVDRHFIDDLAGLTGQATDSIMYTVIMNDGSGSLQVRHEDVYRS